MALENDPALAATMVALTTLLRRAAPAGLTWEYHHWPEEDHGTLPHRVVLHGLSRAYESGRRFDAALEAYERAYALAVESGSPHLGVFVGSLEAIRKKK